MLSYNLPQSSIKVDVAFYDEIEEQKLLKYPTANAIKKIVSKEIDIPIAEFLTYYLFHRKYLHTPQYQDYYAIEKNIYQALAHLDGCITFSGPSIHTVEGAAHQLNEVSEHIGESIGLSVISKIHGLIQTDWALIEPKRGRGAPPTFDFQIASDGTQLIQTETKGSSVENNTILTASIKKHKKDISDKKTTLNELVKKGLDPYPANIRYGTITSVDPLKQGNVRCWLVDPPPEDIRTNPKYFKLINRLNSLLNWILLISPHSQLTPVLATRLRDLKILINPFELNNMPLLKSNSEPFTFKEIDFFGHTTFTTNKSRVVNGPAGGVTIQLSDNFLFLLGIREELLQIVADQNFDEINSFKAEVDTVHKRVECVFSKQRFERLTLPSSIKKEVKENSGYFKFFLEGDIHYSSTGIVFGILPLHNK